MEEKKKRGKVFTVFFVIIAVLYAIIIELAKNILVGWLCAAVILAVFFIIRPLLSTKRWYVRLCSWLVLFVALFISFKFTYPPYKQVPAVTVKDPEVTGVISVSEGDLTGVYNKDKSVEVYAGIPFAKPPVGELRWKETEAPEPWDGIRACDTFGPMSMQQEGSTIWNRLGDIVIYKNPHLFNPNENSQGAMKEQSR